MFLGSFIFFYPDVVTGQALPITGGLAAVCAFAALLIKLMSKGDADLNGMRAQVLLIGLGAALYITPYFFGSQMTMLTGHLTDQFVPAPRLVDEPGRRPAALLPVRASLIGIMGLVAVGYNLRQTTRRPKAA